MFERTLIITPHFDDETIGCGGLIHKIAKDKNKELLIVVVATHKDTYNYNAGRVVSNEERKEESLGALSRLGVPRESLVQLEGFEDGRLDMVDKKSLITALDYHIRNFKPTTVLFPYSSHHQDHQAVYNASVAALRTTVDTNYIKLKAMYEYPYVNSWSSNLDLNSKLYVPLSEEDIESKRDALNAYESQLLRDPRDIISISSIITLSIVRGTEIGRNYAEAFYPMTMVVGGEDL